jgi:hypothetical protein
VTVVALLAVGGVGLGHAFANDDPHAASVGVSAVTTPAPPVLATPVSVPPASPAAPSAPASPTAPPAKKPTRSTPTAPHHPPKRPAGPAALTVTDLGPACYLEVKTANGHLLIRRILHGHQRFTFRPHGLHVVLGNAGAVKIAIDGHPAHRAGRVGQVRVFKVR